MAQHLRVLRDGFATVHSAGTRRIYSLDLFGIDAVDAMISP